MRDASANQQATTRTTLDTEGCFTGGMTDARISARGVPDTGKAGDGTSDAPMDEAMEMGMAATPVAAETLGATIVDPMDRNGNVKQRRKSEAVATAMAPSDSVSLMDRTM